LTFEAILQSLEGVGIKFIDVTQNFKIVYSEKCSKFRSSPNLESYVHAQKNNIGGSCFLLINKLQPKIIYVCSGQVGHNTDLIFVSTAQIHLTI